MTNAEATERANELIEAAKTNPELARMILALVCDDEQLATLATAAKNAEISRRILAHVSAGKSIRQAWDLVHGDGALRAFSDNLYDTIRATTVAA
jgi:hypothetical protein